MKYKKTYLLQWFTNNDNHWLYDNITRIVKISHASNLTDYCLLFEIHSNPSSPYVKPTKVIYLNGTCNGKELIILKQIKNIFTHLIK